MSATAHRSDRDIIASVHNVSRFCVETRQIAWVLLVGTIAWGIYGYFHMPQRKDPDVPIKQAKVITPWPGAGAEKVEQLLTREIEKTIASNSNVSRIESVSRSNVSEITFTLSNRLTATGQTLDDIGQRLSGITSLPQGAGPSTISATSAIPRRSC
jgi:multidrug efflux pump subunit AcrB